MKEERSLRGSALTGRERSATEILKDMAELAQEVAAKAGVGLDQINSIGVGSPGHLMWRMGLLFTTTILVSQRSGPYRTAKIHAITGLCR